MESCKNALWSAETGLKEDGIIEQEIAWDERRFQASCGSPSPVQAHNRYMLFLCYAAILV